MIKQARHKFVYHQYSILDHVHSGWDKEILNFALANSVFKELEPCSVTSREHPDVKSVPTLTVKGDKIRAGLPWLFKLYEELFYELGKACVNEQLLLAKNDLYALNLNVQKGNKMRYECHIDSNPLQGVLYVTDHSKGSGGELVVSNNPNAIGMAEIDEDCEIFYPKSGTLMLFNAWHNPHYVKPLKNENGVRVSVPMNFYTESSPESARPEDLNDHLFPHRAHS
jgi:2-oxoglutarate-Fe(II)-dependent oxygenase superfamily protein